MRTLSSYCKYTHEEVTFIFEVVVGCFDDDTKQTRSAILTTDDVIFRGKLWIFLMA